MRTSFAVIAMLLTTSAYAQDVNLKQFGTPEEVVAEHSAALNACDLERIMAQYPANAEIHLSDGVVLEGREAIRGLFEGFCKSPDDGGLGGLTITAEKTTVVDNTVNVQWRAEASYLAEPYKGSDAFVTHDGYMQAQVTTFDVRDMKRR